MQKNRRSGIILTYSFFVFDQPPPYSGINDPQSGQHAPMYPPLGNQIPAYQTPQNVTPYPNPQQAPPYHSNPSNVQPSAPPPSYDAANRLPEKSKHD